jgi:hypothetical protein
VHGVASDDVSGHVEFLQQLLHGRNFVGFLIDFDVGERQGRIDRERAEHLFGFGVVEIVEAALQRFAVERDDAPRPVGRASDKGYHALSAAPQVEDWRFAGRSIRRSTGSLLIRHDFVLAPSPARGHGKYYVYLVWGILIIPGTSTMTDPAAKKRIVIVGSGFGGMAAAN